MFQRAFKEEKPPTPNCLILSQALVDEGRVKERIGQKLSVTGVPRAKDEIFTAASKEKKS